MAVRSIPIDSAGFRRLRDSHRLSAPGMAAIMGVSYRHVYRLESNSTFGTSLASLDRLAAWFGALAVSVLITDASERAVFLAPHPVAHDEAELTPPAQRSAGA